MRYIDLHCDTLLKIYKARETLVENNAQIDLTKLKKGNCVAQFFAIFMEPIREDKERMPDIDFIKELCECHKTALAQTNGEIISINSILDFDLAMKQKKISAFLTLEDGRALDSVERLEWLNGLGFKLVTLTWNHRNLLGSPCSDDKIIMNEGLSKLGFDIVSRMNELNMLVDVSHLSDRGFYDAAEISAKYKQPFVASHSNARALCPHRRNLSDDMIRIVANSGGCIGVNFVPYFLKDKKSNSSDLELIASHIKHIQNIGGVEVTALGTDFDGADDDFAISNASEMGLLFDYLSKSGFSCSGIEALAYGNAERVIRSVL